MEKNNLIPHSTINTMVETWQMIQAKIRNASDILRDCESKLGAVFGDGSLYLHYGIRDIDAERQINEIRIAVWRAIINKTEIKRFLSMQRLREIEKRITDGEMGEVTVENVVNMLRSAAANINTMLDEAVVEVFEMLHPHTGYKTGYKNNEKFANELGKKVVLHWLDEWHVKIFKKPSLSTWGEDRFRAINKVFYLLDGKQVSTTTYGGDLVDAISEGLWEGETEYFRFKCYLNGNVHLEFKRLDLVSKMNGIVTKNVLKRKAS